MKRKIDMFNVSYQGLRKENQDRVLILQKKKEKLFLIAVADGMGGHQDGDKAAEIAIECLKNVVNNNEFFENFHSNNRMLIKEAVVSANHEIKKYADDNGISNDVGTTLTGALSVSESLYIFNVGDSRTYRITNGSIHQITKDHTADLDALERGVISEEEVGKTAYSNALMRALGTHDEIEVDIFPEKGDTSFPIDEDLILLSCSDGLWGKVNAKEIHNELIRRRNIKESVENLSSLAFMNKSSDNISLSAIEYGRVKRTKPFLASYKPMYDLTNSLLKKYKRKVRFALLLSLLFLIIIGVVGSIFFISNGNPKNNINIIKTNSLGVEIIQKASKISWSSYSKDASYKFVLFSQEGEQIFSQKIYNKIEFFDLNSILDNLDKSKSYLGNVIIKSGNSVFSAYEGIGVKINLEFMTCVKESDGNESEKLVPNVQRRGNK